jgi:hypothetical protein
LCFCHTTHTYDTSAAAAAKKTPPTDNAKMDEEYAPVSGPNSTYFQTLDDEEDRETLLENNDPLESGCDDQGDGTPGSCPLSELVDVESGANGPSVENVIVGFACGRLVTAVATEGGSTALLFDITDITSPDLVQVLNLSPASQYMSLGLAYNRGELGEIDPETGVFLTAEQSPDGHGAGILWAGAHSGTVSFWEIKCREEVAAPPTTTTTATSKST